MANEPQAIRMNQENAPQPLRATTDPTLSARSMLDTTTATPTLTAKTPTANVPLTANMGSKEPLATNAPTLTAQNPLAPNATGPKTAQNPLGTQSSLYTGKEPLSSISQSVKNPLGTQSTEMGTKDPLATISQTEKAPLNMQGAPISSLEAPKLSEDTSVQSRINSILDENSALSKRAEAYGNLQANQSGALGSSMGARAAYSSLLDQASNIAATDAATAARFEELGFSHNSTIAQLDAQQKARLEQMDKEFGFSQKLLDKTQEFQRWGMEQGWDEQRIANTMQMYTSMGSSLMNSMAAMAGSQQVTAQEGKDQMQTAQDLMDSLFTIGGMDFELEDIA